jgi:hypothetical protein
MTLELLLLFLLALVDGRLRLSTFVMRRAPPMAMKVG